MKDDDYKNNAWLKQYRTGIWIGGVKNTLQNTMSYITVLNLVLLIVTSYSVTVRSFVIQFIPWFNIYIFVGAVAVFILVMMVIEFKIVQPSCWAFNNWQGYEHDNPMVTDLKTIIAKQDALQVDLKTVMEAQRVLQKELEELKKK